MDGNLTLIVAVYEDWGIGRDGTQPVALSADRKFFREMTRGAAVIVGRRTAEDFPGCKPLPGRKNVLLTRSAESFPGFLCCHTPEEAMAAAQDSERVFVIGGGSVYRQMLPYCSSAYVTHVGTSPASDTYFPNLAEDPHWYCAETLQDGVEDGISYEMRLYRRK